MYMQAFDGNKDFLSMPDVITDNEIPYYRMYSMYINDLAKEKEKLELEVGNWISQEETPYIEVVLGYDFLKHFKVGDTFEMLDLNDKRIVKKAKVVGFLKEKSTIVKHLDAEFKDRDVNLDKYIIVNDKRLINNLDIGGDIIFQNILYLNESMTINEIHLELDKIVAAFKAENVDVYPRYEGGVLLQNLKMLKANKDLAVLTSLIILIFLTLTIILTLVNSILKRKKEFGVYILSGGSKKDIIYIVLGEILTLEIVGYIIFIIGQVTSGKVLNWNILVMIAIGSVSYAIAVSIIPIIKMRKLTVREMINGSE